MSRLKLNTCEIDLRSGDIWQQGQPSTTRLNAVLLDLLRHLVENSDQDIHHDQLRAKVWSDRVDMEQEDDRKRKVRKVYIAVTRLRQAIGDESRPYQHIISSKTGFYRFILPEG